MRFKRSARRIYDTAYDGPISQMLRLYYNVKLGRGRIFGIGLPKTGGTSLVDALKVLGYSAIGYPRRGKEEWRYQAATDTPVTIAFRELDRQYPGSKFILTTRDLDGWLKSCSRHFGEPYDNTMREKLFGTYQFDEPKFRATYERHHREVFNYFAGRSQDLLVYRLGDEQWEPLCVFLGCPIPDVPFPWSNRAAYSASS